VIAQVVEERGLPHGVRDGGGQGCGEEDLFVGERGRRTLRDHRPQRLVLPAQDGHRQEDGEAIFVELVEAAEILVPRRAVCAHGAELLHGEAGEALTDLQSDRALRVRPKADVAAEHQAVAVTLEQIDREDLSAEEARCSRREAVEQRRQRHRARHERHEVERVVGERQLGVGGGA
jgi:hypothetical protein